jgi:hypothetical protein
MLYPILKNVYVLSLKKQQTHAKIISANNEKFETNKHTDFESIEEIKNYIKKSIIFFPYI